MERRSHRMSELRLLLRLLLLLLLRMLATTGASAVKRHSGHLIVVSVIERSIRVFLAPWCSRHACCAHAANPPQRVLGKAGDAVGAAARDR